MAGKIRIEDIAAQACVSVSTVDRVINGRGGVRLDREIRVLDALRSLEAASAFKPAYARQIRVAVILQHVEDLLHDSLKRSFLDVGVQHRTLNIHYYIHHFAITEGQNIATFLQDVRKRYDAVIASVPNETTVRREIRKLSALMPVVLLLTDIPDTSRLAYVGIDNVQAGRVVGSLMGRFLGAQPCSAICLSGFESMAAHTQRREGFRLSLKTRFRHIHLIDVQDSTFDRIDRAADILYHLMAAYPDIRGIYNAGAGGAPLVEAIRKRGRTHDTVFITHELTPDRVQLLKEGAIDALIDQDPLEQVTRASRLIASHFRRLPPVTTPSPTLLRIFTPEMVS